MSARSDPFEKWVEDEEPEDWDDHLPEVAGRRMLKSHARFERQCRLLLKEEQEKIAPDNNLVDALCDAIRLSREHCDLATGNLTK